MCDRGNRYNIKEELHPEKLPKINFIKLEQLVYMKDDLGQFFKTMREKMEQKFDEKGRTYPNCSEKYLREKLIEHIKKGDWIDVGNYSFMLWYLEHQNSLHSKHKTEEK